MMKASASAWLSDLSQATMAPMARWELAGLSGEALVLEGAGALSAGQVASMASVARENQRLEAEGKSPAGYYELGMAAGEGPKAGSASPEAVAVVRALEGRLRGPVPPGMSVGQLMSLESGLKKMEGARAEDVTPEELRAVARAPAAMALAREAGIPKPKLEKAKREERQRRIKTIESSAQKIKAKEQKGALAEGLAEGLGEGLAKSAAEAGEGLKKSIEQWREAKEAAEAPELAGAKAGDGAEGVKKEPKI